MKERPILFSGPMVRAILEGRKTQTRRVWKDARLAPRDLAIGDRSIACPYGAPGDRLWVRETCAIGYSDDAPLVVDYLADGARRQFDLDTPDKDRAALTYINDGRRPSIHMPRWASRITLEVEAVRVERVQDISEADALAEGIERDPFQRWYGTGYKTAGGAFAALWDSINAARGYGWDVNPWVWVVEFKKVQP